MKGPLALVLAALLPLSAAAADRDTTVWLLAQNDGSAWCAFSDIAAFNTAVTHQAPRESAHVTYYGDDILELSHQVNPASGDWVVVDHYAYTNGKLTLRRNTVLLLENLEVVQETAIGGGKAAPFKVVSFATLDGQKAPERAVDYPKVPVATSWEVLPFLAISKKLLGGSVPFLCEKLKP